MKKPCECEGPPNYVEDMCERHQSEYEAYARETAPEDNLGFKIWWLEFASTEEE